MKKIINMVSRTIYRVSYDVYPFLSKKNVLKSDLFYEHHFKDFDSPFKAMKCFSIFYRYSLLGKCENVDLTAFEYYGD